MTPERIYGIPELDLLWLLATQGNVQEAKELISRMSDIPRRGVVLRHLLLLGDLLAAETLLKAGIPVDIAFGEVPMLWDATLRNRADLVSFLLHHGADPYVQMGSSGWLPINMAQSEGYVEIVQLLSARMHELEVLRNQQPDGRGEDAV